MLVTKRPWHLKLVPETKRDAAGSTIDSVNSAPRLMQQLLFLRFTLAIVLLCGSSLPAADHPQALTPDSNTSISFPDLPPTFHDIVLGRKAQPRMTIYLPRNYDRAKKHPLLVYLNGGDGGDGSALGVARSITGQEDFVCVNMPLFRIPGYQPTKPGSPGGNFIITEPDGRAMWPHFKAMLEKVQALVPNLDPIHRVIGGSSNGAHTIAALIDGSDGDLCKIFSAFLCVEGGGKLVHYEHLKGKLFMMVSSQSKSQPRALEITEQAEAAGARTTFLLQDVGAHGFPEAAYSKVMAWLRGPVLE
jgi:hypothetical protein